MIRTVEQTTMRKVYLRVLPIAAVSYFFCYLDRINVGFAALTMNKDRVRRRHFLLGLFPVRGTEQHHS